MVATIVKSHKAEQLESLMDHSVLHLVQPSVDWQFRGRVFGHSHPCQHLEPAKEIIINYGI